MPNRSELLKSRSHFSPFLRTTSALLISAFLAQDVVYANPDIRSSEFGVRSSDVRKNRIEIPEEIGTVEEDHRSPGRRVTSHQLFLIQDAHVNESAQRNIAKIIDHLIDKEKIKTVFLEAGTGDDSLSDLRTLADANKRRDVSERFLRKGYIQGPDYLDINSEKKFQLWGVEDKALYYEAIGLYKQIVKDRDQANAFVDRIRRALRSLKPRIFNSQLLDFDKRRQAYLESVHSLTDYFKTISVVAAEKHVSLLAYHNLLMLKDVQEKESAIDFKKASEEQVALAATLPVGHKIEKVGVNNLKELTDFYAGLEEKFGVRSSEFGELKKYIVYLKAVQKIRHEGLLQEIEEIEHQVYSALTTTEEERVLVRLTYIQEVLGRLLSLKATASDIAQIDQDPTAFTALEVGGILNRQLMLMRSNYEDAILLDERYDAAFEKSKAFYALTKKRDQVFINNIIDKLRVEQQTNAVLVAGGYHTENLKALFRANKISFVSIRPRVTQETNIKKYERLLLEGIQMPRSIVRADAIKKLVNTLPGAEMSLLMNGARVMVRQELVKELSMPSQQAAGARLAEVGVPGLEAIRALYERFDERGGLPRSSFRISSMTHSLHVQHSIAETIASFGSHLHILSVGSGRGDLESALRTMGHRVLGIDASPKNAGYSKAKNVNSVIADAHRLPTQDGEFDVVMFSESIGHMDLERAVAEAYRTLKPGGHVLITLFEEPAPGKEHRFYKDILYVLYTTEQVRSALTTIGFYGYHCNVLSPKLTGRITAYHVITAQKPDGRAHDPNGARLANTDRSGDAKKIVMDAMASADDTLDSAKRTIRAIAQWAEKVGAPYADMVKVYAELAQSADAERMKGVLMSKSWRLGHEPKISINPDRFATRMLYAMESSEPYMLFMLNMIPVVVREAAGIAYAYARSSKKDGASSGKLDQLKSESKKIGPGFFETYEPLILELAAEFFAIEFFEARAQQDITRWIYRTQGFTRNVQLELYLIMDDEELFGYEMSHSMVTLVRGGIGSVTGFVYSAFFIMMGYWGHKTGNKRGINRETLRLIQDGRGDVDPIALRPAARELYPVVQKTILGSQPMLDQWLAKKSGARLARVRTLDELLRAPDVDLTLGGVLKEDVPLSTGYSGYSEEERIGMRAIELYAKEAIRGFRRRDRSEKTSGVYKPSSLRLILPGLKEAGVASGKTVLELGHGEGILSHVMAHLLGADVTGIEKDPFLFAKSQAIQKALIERLGRDLSDQLRFLEGDFTEHPWSSYDFVYYYSFGATYTNEIVLKAITEMKPGSKFLLFGDRDSIQPGKTFYDELPVDLLNSGEFELTRYPQYGLWVFEKLGAGARLAREDFGETTLNGQLFDARRLDMEKMKRVDLWAQTQQKLGASMPINTPSDVFVYSFQLPDRAGHGIRGIWIDPDLRGKKFLRPIISYFLSVFPETQYTHPDTKNLVLLDILSRDFGFKPMTITEPNAYAVTKDGQRVFYMTHQNAEAYRERLKNIDDMELIAARVESVDSLDSFRADKDAQPLYMGHILKREVSGARLAQRPTTDIHTLKKKVANDVLLLNIQVVALLVALSIAIHSFDPGFILSQQLAVLIALVSVAVSAISTARYQAQIRDIGSIGEHPFGAYAVDALATVLTHWGPAKRIAAVRSLRQIGTAEALTVIRRAFAAEKNLNVKSEMTKKGARLSSALADEVVGRLRSSDDMVRRNALLAMFRDQHFTPLRDEIALLALLDPSDSVRQKIADMIGGHDESRIPLNIPMDKLLLHLETPMATLDTFPTLPYSVPGGAYSEVVGRRNKRAALLWAIGYRRSDRVDKAVIHTWLSARLEEWSPRKDRTLQSQVIRNFHSRNELGEKESQSLLEIMRLVHLRDDLIRLLRRTDRFFWIRERMDMILNSLAFPAVNKVIYGEHSRKFEDDVLRIINGSGARLADPAKKSVLFTQVDIKNIKFLLFDKSPANKQLALNRIREKIRPEAAYISGSVKGHWRAVEPKVLDQAFLALFSLVVENALDLYFQEIDKMGAVREDFKVEIRSYMEDGDLVIRVTSNGVNSSEAETTAQKAALGARRLGGEGVATPVIRDIEDFLGVTHRILDREAVDGRSGSIYEIRLAESGARLADHFKNHFEKYIPELMRRGFTEVEATLITDEATATSGNLHRVSADAPQQIEMAIQYIWPDEGETGFRFGRPTWITNIRKIIKKMTLRDGRPAVNAIPSTALREKVIYIFGRLFLDHEMATLYLRMREHDLGRKGADVMYQALVDRMGHIDREQVLRSRSALRDIEDLIESVSGGNLEIFMTMMAQFIFFLANNDRDKAYHIFSSYVSSGSLTGAAITEGPKAVTFQYDQGMVSSNSFAPQTAPVLDPDMLMTRPVRVYTKGSSGLLTDTVVSDESYAPNRASSAFFREHIQPTHNSNVLIIGSGTGADAIVAAHRGAMRVVATDKPGKTRDLSLNVQNAPRSIRGHIKVVEADLFDLPDEYRKRKYRHIYANPPIYVPGKAATDNEIDADLSFLNGLLSGAHSFLSPKGTLELTYVDDPIFFDAVYRHGWRPVWVEGYGMSKELFAHLKGRESYLYLVLVPSLGDQDQALIQKLKQDWSYLVTHQYDRSKLMALAEDYAPIKDSIDGTIILKVIHDLLGDERYDPAEPLVHDEYRSLVSHRIAAGARLAVLLEDGPVQIWQATPTPVLPKFPNYKYVAGFDEGATWWKGEPERIRKFLSAIRPEVLQRLSSGNVLLQGIGRHADETQFILEQFPQAQSISIVDGDLENLRRLKRILESQSGIPHEKVKLYHANFSSMPFPDGYFDIVYSNNTYHRDFLNYGLMDWIDELDRIMANDGVYITAASSAKQFMEKGLRLVWHASGFLWRFLAIKSTDILTEAALNGSSDVQLYRKGQVSDHNYDNPNGNTDEFSWKTRNAILSDLAAHPEQIWDLVVVGGGIAGVSAANEARRRGLKVLLVEKEDLASGTSSHSSRIIHGNPRYLEIAWKALLSGDLISAKRNFHHVRGALGERAAWFTSAPDLIRHHEFYVPSFKGDPRGFFKLLAGLTIYNALGRAFGIPPVDFLPYSALKRFAFLAKALIKGGVFYHDGLVNDAALVRRIAYDAHRRGASILTHMQVDTIYKQGDSDFRVGLTDRTGRYDHQWIRSKAVVNARGPKVADGGTLDPKNIILDRGTHITVTDPAIVDGFDHPFYVQMKDSERLFFVIPQETHGVRFLRIGTTDREVKSSVEDQTSTDEIAEIVQAFNRAFPGKALGPGDIRWVDAGIRTLYAPSATTAVSASQVSREHQIIKGKDGVIYVIGVKLTDGLRAAREIMDKVISRLDPVQASVRSDEPFIAPPALTGVGADAWIRHAVRYEMLFTLNDLMLRHDGEIVFGDNYAAVDDASRILKEELGWDEARRLDELARYGTVKDRTMAIIGEWAEASSQMSGARLALDHDTSVQLVQDLMDDLNIDHGRETSHAMAEEVISIYTGPDGRDQKQKKVAELLGFADRSKADKEALFIFIHEALSRSRTPEVLALFKKRLGSSYVYQSLLDAIDRHHILYFSEKPMSLLYKQKDIKMQDDPKRSSTVVYFAKSDLGAMKAVPDFIKIFVGSGYGDGNYLEYILQTVRAEVIYRLYERAASEGGSEQQLLALQHALEKGSDYPILMTYLLVLKRAQYYQLSPDEIRETQQKVNLNLVDFVDLHETPEQSAYTAENARTHAVAFGPFEGLSREFTANYEIWTHTLDEFREKQRSEKITFRSQAELDTYMRARLPLLIESLLGQMSSEALFRDDAFIRDTQTVHYGPLDAPTLGGDEGVSHQIKSSAYLNLLIGAWRKGWTDKKPNYDDIEWVIKVQNVLAQIPETVDRYDGSGLAKYIQRNLLPEAKYPDIERAVKNLIALAYIYETSDQDAELSFKILPKISGEMISTQLLFLDGERRREYQDLSEIPEFELAAVRYIPGNEKGSDLIYIEGADGGQFIVKPNGEFYGVINIELLSGKKPSWTLTIQSLDDADASPEMVESTIALGARLSEMQIRVADLYTARPVGILVRSGRGVRLEDIRQIQLLDRRGPSLGVRSVADLYRRVGGLSPDTRLAVFVSRDAFAVDMEFYRDHFAALLNARRQARPLILKYRLDLAEQTAIKAYLSDPGLREYAKMALLKTRREGDVEIILDDASNYTKRPSRSLEVHDMNSALSVIQERIRALTDKIQKMRRRGDLKRSIERTYQDRHALKEHLASMRRQSGARLAKKSADAVRREALDELIEELGALIRELRYHKDVPLQVSASIQALQQDMVTLTRLGMGNGLSGFRGKLQGSLKEIADLRLYQLEGAAVHTVTVLERAHHLLARARDFSDAYSVYATAKVLGISYTTLNMAVWRGGIKVDIGHRFKEERVHKWKAALTMLKRSKLTIDSKYIIEVLKIIDSLDAHEDILEEVRDRLAVPAHLRGRLMSAREVSNKIDISLSTIQEAAESGRLYADHTSRLQHRNRGLSRYYFDKKRVARWARLLPRLQKEVPIRQVHTVLSLALIDKGTTDTESRRLVSEALGLPKDRAADLIDIQAVHQMTGIPEKMLSKAAYAKSLDADYVLPQTKSAQYIYFFDRARAQKWARLWKKLMTELQISQNYGVKLLKLIDEDLSDEAITESAKRTLSNFYKVKLAIEDEKARLVTAGDESGSPTGRAVAKRAGITPTHLSRLRKADPAIDSLFGARLAETRVSRNEKVQYRLPKKMATSEMFAKLRKNKIRTTQISTETFISAEVADVSEQGVALIFLDRSGRRSLLGIKLSMNSNNIIRMAEIKIRKPFKLVAPLKIGSYVRYDHNKVGVVESMGSERATVRSVDGEIQVIAIGNLKRLYTLYEAATQMDGMSQVTVYKAFDKGLLVPYKTVPSNRTADGKALFDEVALQSFYDHIRPPGLLSSSDMARLAGVSRSSLYAAMSTDPPRIPPDKITEMIEGVKRKTEGVWNEYWISPDRLGEVRTYFGIDIGSKVPLSEVAKLFRASPATFQNAAENGRLKNLTRRDAVRAGKTIHYYYIDNDRYKDWASKLDLLRTKGSDQFHRRIKYNIIDILNRIDAGESVDDIALTFMTGDKNGARLATMREVFDGGERYGLSNRAFTVGDVIGVLVGKATDRPERIEVLYDHFENYEVPFVATPQGNIYQAVVIDIDPVRNRIIFEFGSPAQDGYKLRSTRPIDYRYIGKWKKDAPRPIIERLLPSNEAAKMAGISDATLRAAVSEGRLKADRKVKETLRLSGVERWNYSFRVSRVRRWAELRKPLQEEFKIDGHRTVEILNIIDAYRSEKRVREEVERQLDWRYLVRSSITQRREKGLKLTQTDVANDLDISQGYLVKLGKRYPEIQASLDEIMPATYPRAKKDISGSRLSTQNLEKLLNDRADELRGLARKRLRNFSRTPEDIEDIIQDTFVRAYSSLDRYNPAMTVEEWFIGILRHVESDFGRKKNGRGPFVREEPEQLIEEEHQSTALAAGLVERIIEAQQRGILNGAVLQLPERLAYLIRLKISDPPISDAQIAALIGGVSRGRVSQLFRVAKERLAKLIGLNDADPTASDFIRRRESMTEGWVESIRKRALDVLNDPDVLRKLTRGQVYLLDSFVHRRSKIMNTRLLVSKVLAVYDRGEEPTMSAYRHDVMVSLAKKVAASGMLILDQKGMIRKATLVSGRGDKGYETAGLSPHTLLLLGTLLMTLGVSERVLTIQTRTVYPDRQMSFRGTKHYIGPQFVGHKVVVMEMADLGPGGFEVRSLDGKTLLGVYDPRKVDAKLELVRPAVTERYRTVSDSGYFHMYSTNHYIGSRFKGQKLLIKLTTGKDLRKGSFDVYSNDGKVLLGRFDASKPNAKLEIMSSVIERSYVVSSEGRIRARKERRYVGMDLKGQKILARSTSAKDLKEGSFDIYSSDGAVLLGRYDADIKKTVRYKQIESEQDRSVAGARLVSIAADIRSLMQGFVVGVALAAGPAQAQMNAPLDLRPETGRFEIAQVSKRGREIHATVGDVLDYRSGVSEARAQLQSNGSANAEFITALRSYDLRTMTSLEMIPQDKISKQPVVIYVDPKIMGERGALQFAKAIDKSRSNSFMKNVHFVLVRQTGDPLADTILAMVQKAGYRNVFLDSVPADLKNVSRVNLWVADESFSPIEQQVNLAVRPYDPNQEQAMADSAIFIAAYAGRVSWLRPSTEFLNVLESAFKVRPTTEEAQRMFMGTLSISTWLQKYSLRFFMGPIDLGIERQALGARMAEQSA